MPITRSILFGALAALFIPNIMKYMGGSVGEYTHRLSIVVNLGDTHIRWSWSIFFLVTALTFALLLLTKDR